MQQPIEKKNRPQKNTRKKFFTKASPGWWEEIQLNNTYICSNLSTTFDNEFSAFVEFW